MNNININKYVNIINKESSDRIKEINYMFTQINLDNTAISNKNLDNNKYTNTMSSNERYFIARAIVVFTYATVEKFVKNLSQIALRTILDTNYFNNNYVKEMSQILKYKNKPKDLFDLLMYTKGTFHSRQTFDLSNDKGYFSKNGRIDSETIAHIVNVFNLNKNEPYIKIPKITIDSICKNRMYLAHGDYLKELNKFSPSRNDLNIKEVNKYINDVFKLNNTTRKEIIEFIESFKSKVIELLEEIKEYQNI